MDVLQFLFIFLVTFFGLLCICICVLYCVCEKGCLKKRKKNIDVEKQTKPQETTKSGKEEVEMEDRKMYVNMDRRSKVLHKQLSAEMASELKKGDVTPQKIKSRNSVDVDKEESLQRNNKKSRETQPTTERPNKLPPKPKPIPDTLDDNASFYMEQNLIAKNLQDSRDSFTSSRNSLLDSTGSLTIPDLMGARRLSTANDFASLIAKEEQ